MRLKIEITTVYRLILLSPLMPFTEYSQLEDFRFGANCWHVIGEVERFYYELLKLSYVKVEKLENYSLRLK